MKKYLGIILMLFVATSMFAQDSKYNLVVGTYTKGCESKGVYVYDFDSHTGDLKLKNATDNVDNPNFLTVSAGNNFIYTVNVNATENFASAFRYNPADGKLEFINKQETKGNGPCYIINSDKNVITANYGDGTITVFGKNPNGGLTEARQVIRHTGKSINSTRQDKPHAHMVLFSPDKKYVLANDLGTDKIYVYDYNPNSLTEILKLKDTVSVTPGSGPRHLTFSKDNNYIYLLQEITGALTTFSYTNGKLKKLEEKTVVDKDFKGSTGAADIHVSPDGKFLYATNRGTANDISVFKILNNGKLEFIQRTSTLGKGPRNFAIDPTGNYLLVGHQYTNNIVIFKRDKATGLLSDTGKKVDLCSPVCLVFTRNK